MSRSIAGLLAAGAVVVLFGWAANSTSAVTVHSIVADPAAVDRQNVTVVGSVADLKETTSHAGNDYATFKLEDADGDALTIFTWGHPALTNDERVSVGGIFETVHRAGRYTFYNELEATSIAPTRQRTTNE